MSNDAEKFLLELVRDLRADQIRLGAKFDDLAEFIITHMREEEQNMSQIRERIIKIEQVQKYHAGSWKHISTIIIAAAVSLVTLIIKGIFVWPR